MSDFNSIGVVNGLETSMTHLAKRQRVISENLANTATPRYRARDVARPDFSRLLTETQNAAQQSSSNSIIAKPTVTKPQITSKITEIQPHVRNIASEQRANGNDVMIEQEMVKMADVQAEYAAVSNLYRKARQTVKTALGRQ